MLFVNNGKLKNDSKSCWLLVVGCNGQRTTDNEQRTTDNKPVLAIAIALTATLDKGRTVEAKCLT